MLATEANMLRRCHVILRSFFSFKTEPTRPSRQNQTHLVKVLHHRGQARQYAFTNANADTTIVVGLRGVGQHAQCLQNGHNERPKTNRTKRRCDGTQKGIVNGRRTAAARFSGFKPPVAHHARDTGMNGTLDASAKKKRQKKKKNKR